MNRTRSTTDSSTAGGPIWPNARHACEVELDPATGEVAVVAYASVNDIGRVVSPTIVKGQVECGAVQGIGKALMERVAYDAETGQLQSARFMDYAMPHADGFLGLKTAFDASIPCKTNPLGVKGIGGLLAQVVSSFAAGALSVTSPGARNRLHRGSCLLRVPG